MLAGVRSNDMAGVNITQCTHVYRGRQRLIIIIFIEEQQKNIITYLMQANEAHHHIWLMGIGAKNTHTCNERIFAQNALFAHTPSRSPRVRECVRA